MEIVLPEKHSLGIKWFRGKSRFDTMTDVKFLNETTLIAANRECGKIYIVQVSLNPTHAKVIYSTDIVFNNQLKYIDLFTVKDGIVYFVSLDNTIGILKLENNKLIKLDLITVPKNYYFHSITFHPINSNIVYIGSALFNPKLVIYNIVTKTVLQEVSLQNMETLLIKDVKFLDENTIVVSGTCGLISMTNKQHTYNSRIGVYNANTFDCIDFITLQNAHTDGIGLDDQNNIYLACQGDSAENLLKFTFENNRLIRQKGYMLPQFPHGFDVKYGMIACSSLKNSSICLFRTDSL
jgi:hypothetical protein